MATRIDFKQAEVFIQDGTPSTPNRISVRIGDGNLTYDETKNRDYFLNRGKLDDVSDGDEVPVSVAFDAVWEYIKGGLDSLDDPSIEDALKQRGNAAGWISTDDDPCRPYSVDVLIYYTPNCSSGDKELISLLDFRYESIAHDIGAATLAFAGQCNITEAQITRVSASSTAL